MGLERASKQLERPNPALARDLSSDIRDIVYLTHHAARRGASLPPVDGEMDGISSCNLEELCSNDPYGPPSSERRLLKRKGERFIPLLVEDGR